MRAQSRDHVLQSRHLGRVPVPPIDHAHQLPIPLGAGIRDDLKLLEQYGTTAGLRGIPQNTGQDLRAFRGLRRHTTLKRSARVHGSPAGRGRGAGGDRKGRGLRQARCRLRQVDAWIELAELIQDPDFRGKVRALADWMPEHHRTVQRQQAF
jgi:hypothetical protein